MFRKFFERRRVQKIFGTYLSPERIEQVISGDTSAVDVTEIKEAAIDYVVVMVRGANPSEISTNMGLVAKIAHDHHAVVDCMVSGMVVLLYGTMPFVPDRQGDRVALVATLREQLGDDIKIVHGDTHGHYGTLGGPSRYAFSVIIPDFAEILMTLGQLRFGEAKEIAGNITIEQRDAPDSHSAGSK